MTPPVALAAADYVDPTHASYAWSLGVGVIWLTIGLGAFIVFVFVRAFLFSRQRAREEREMLDLAARPLSPGPHRVVRGRVDLDGPDDVAIQIDIDQAVRDRTSKSRRWHTWEETWRETHKSPFYLVREDGDEVYVEPPDDVFVVDQIETKYPMNAPRTRVRFADVRRGETFYAYGDLERGSHARAKSAYRDGGSGWILRSPRRRMLLATEIIRDRYRERISYLYFVGGALAVMFIFLHSVMSLSFLDVWLSGRQTVGTVINRGSWFTTNKSTRIAHYSLTVRTHDGTVFTQEVSGRLYSAMSPTTPGVDAPTLPVLECRDSPSSSFLGYEPTMPILWLALGFSASILAMVLTAAGYQKSVPWYDRRRLDEPGGDGFWIETRPRNPVTHD